MPRWSGAVLCALLVPLAAAEAPAADPVTRASAGTALRAPTLNDLHRLETLAEPDLSPDGRWVAYSVSRNDADADAVGSDLWLAPVDGGSPRRLTHSAEASEWLPRWSPDGRALAFLSDRESDDGGVQVWVLPRDGGEARRVTNFPGGASDLDWSPDGTRLAVIASDPEPDAALPLDERTPRPIVIDRYQFKEDVTGFLERRRQHLYVVDVDDGDAVLLTPGDHDEALPAWSPDGRWIAFSSKRGGDPDRHVNHDLWLADPAAPGTVRRLTTFAGPDLDPYWESRPAWSPDSRRIAYLEGGEARWIYYAPAQLAVVDVADGTVSRPGRLDRMVTKPRWSADGRAVYLLLEENRRTGVARVDLRSGTVTAITRGARFDVDFDLDARRLVVLGGDDLTPARLSVLAPDGRDERVLPGHHDWMRAVQWQRPRVIRFASRDGTPIEGFLLEPPGRAAGTRVPTLLQLHGGPVYQYSHEFQFDWQLFAAAGYAVVAPNPRGSSGRGFDFARAIYADWGGKDAEDVLAAVDHAVAEGVADPARLGVGGWSYGGILTDFVIAKDRRFAAAVSGAGAGNALGTWGTDQYVREYTAELGTPWGDTETYLRMSYPLLHADRIRTPTLFLCGQEDFNVPLIGSEQLYQALRVLEVPTQLVIYPGEFHAIERPSFARDVLERQLAWYGRFLAPAAP